MSKLNQAPESFTFDDFTLELLYSTVSSRKDPDISLSSGKVMMNIPVYSSPMNTVTESAMIKTMLEVGGAAVLHRYMSIQDQIDIVNEIHNLDDLSFGYQHMDRVFVSVGSKDITERVNRLIEAGVRSFCVDVANGHAQGCIDAVKTIRAKGDNLTIMAGNVCSYDGAIRLADVGTDIVRVGVGGGSVCTTRVVTGHGVPQLTAIEECSKVKDKYSDLVILADGGIRGSGDIVKALAIGADAVMLGSLLAGTDSTPGETHRDPDTGATYKYYHGMASTKGRGTWFNTSKTNYVPEGESTRMPCKGDTKEIVDNLMGGLRTGMSMSGALNLRELRERAVWRRVSSSSVIEATPHGKR